MKKLGLRSPVFDGDDFLQTSYPVNPTGGFSVAVVFRSPVLDGYYLIAADNNGATRRLDFTLSSTVGRCFVRVYNGVSDFIGQQHDGDAFQNVLTVLLFTYDGGASENGIKIFRQGVLASSVGISGGTYTVPGAGDPLYVAARQSGTANRFEGYMPELVFFNVPLSSTEVSQVSSTLMNRHCIPGAPLGSDYYKDFNEYSNLRLWLKDEGFALVGGKVYQWNDSSNSGNHATQGTDANRPVLSRSDTREEPASHCAPFQQALSDEKVHPRIFVKLDLATTLQYWSGQGLRNFLGRTYSGNGFFQGIGQLSSMTFDDSGALEIALAGEVTALRALIQGTNRFATGTVYLALYNSSNQLIGYDTLFQGELDSAEISGGLGSTLSLTFSPLAETLGEFTTRVWSNAFHQTEFPDDIAFEYMPQLEEWSGYWGKPDNVLKKSQQGRNRTRVKERRTRRTERGRRRKQR